MIVGMNHRTISWTAPRLSLGLTVVFLILLTLLHGLAPEFNSGHLISEYQLSDYGFLMSLAFCLLGGGRASTRSRAGVSRGQGSRAHWLVGATYYWYGFLFRGYLSSRSGACRHWLFAWHIRTCRD